MESLESEGLGTSDFPPAHAGSRYLAMQPAVRKGRDGGRLQISDFKILHFAVDVPSKLSSASERPALRHPTTAYGARRTFRSCLFKPNANTWRGVAIGDRFDVHGTCHAHKSQHVKRKMNNYMGTFCIPQTSLSSRIINGLIENLGRILSGTSD